MHYLIDNHCSESHIITDRTIDSNQSKDPAKILEAAEKDKKKKYLKACLDQRRHFTPFVVSTCGVVGKEGKKVLARIAHIISQKSARDYSDVCGFVRARMSIAITRATQYCIRGSRIPTSQMTTRIPQWDDTAGMGMLYRNY